MKDKYFRSDSFSREVNFLLDYEDYALKTLKLFYFLEQQGG